VATIGNPNRLELLLADTEKSNTRPPQLTSTG